MIAIVLKLLSSRFGGYAIAGCVALMLGGILAATTYVKNLTIAAIKGERDAALADVTLRMSERDMALAANARFKNALNQVTIDLDQSRTRAVRSIADLAAAKADVKIRTITITKEVNRANTIADDAPLPAGFRAVFDGLRDAYGDVDGH